MGVIKTESVDKRSGSLFLFGAVVAACVVLCFTLVACGGEQNPAEADDSWASSDQASVKDVPEILTPEQKLQKQAEEKCASLTLDQKVDQLFLITPEQLDGLDDTVDQAGNATVSSLESHQVGGVIFFENNIQDPQQTTDMISTLQATAQNGIGLSLFIGVDEEGGTVSRVASNPAMGVEDVGDMSDIGASGDASQAAQVGTTISGYLAPLGFNVDFAPDADVYDPSVSSIMALRSFGTDPSLVAQMVSAETKAMTEGEVLSCVKHYPGHGSVTGDSHSGLVATEKTWEQLQQSDLVPFNQAVQDRVPFIMVGHISCPSVTGDATPASLSPTMVDVHLRQEMGYEGIIITDSLSMGAVVNDYGADQAAVLALQAGNDMLLMPQDFTAARQSILDAVANGTVTQDRIDESVKRIIAAKLRMQQK